LQHLEIRSNLLGDVRIAGIGPNRLSGERKMRIRSFQKNSLFLACLLVMCTQTTVNAQSGATHYAPPPVSAPLVREGDFAIKLNSGLGFGSADDEVEAENRLADAGISPENGWIADYPVTPDVIGELQQAMLG
jgi:hypothetical protein